MHPDSSRRPGRSRTDGPLQPNLLLAEALRDEADDSRTDKDVLNDCAIARIESGGLIDNANDASRNRTI